MKSAMRVRGASEKELDEWVRLRKALWPEEPLEQLRAEARAIHRRKARNAVFLAAAGAGKIVGFVEASLRQYAEGCESSPVGYVEGWYVEPLYRRRGIGRILLKRAERWATAKGCTEMASDAVIRNYRSHKVHRATGYQEVERLVCFRKRLRIRPL